MNSKIFFLRSRLAMVFMVLAASFQWSCVEIEEPRETRGSRSEVKATDEKPNVNRVPSRVSPGQRNPVENKRLGGNNR